MRSISRLRSPLRVKSDSIGADGTFSGYGSVANLVDSGADVVARGAFAATLKRHAENGTRPKLLSQHCAEHPIGTWLEMREDDYGLFCRGRLILDVEKGRETYALMKAGELDGLSIGYEVVSWENASPADLDTKYGIPAGYAMPSGMVRVLKQIELWEVSVVTFPMQQAARVESVKNAVRPALDLTPISAALERRGRLYA